LSHTGTVQIRVTSQVPENKYTQLIDSTFSSTLRDASSSVVARSDSYLRGMTSNDGGSNSSTPMTMATSAQEKLAASARKLIRNVEDAISKKNNSDTNSKEGGSSIESAFRAMFSVCTNGAGMVSSEAKDLDLSVAPCNGSGTPRVEWCDPTDPRASSQPQEASQQPGLSSTAKSDNGEHIYAQLFFDDQIRAAKAVNAVRDQDYKSPEVTTRAFPVPRPFHVSAPHQTSPFRRDSAPLKSDELNIPCNTTFDDSISAISAHTLEAMEQSQKAQLLKLQSQSSESLLFPALNPRLKPPSSAQRQEGSIGASPSPFALPRSRSSKSWCSRNSGRFSTPSKNSHSTRTTQSSASFEHMWNHQEAKFWEKEVQQDETFQRGTNLSLTQRNRSSRLDKHPHDTVHFEQSEFFGNTYFNSDPNRLVHVLDIAEDAELAEI
jgi:hypothetical protein